MYNSEDIESAFWKEKVMHLVHENMNRHDAKALYIQDAEEEINRFIKENSLQNAKITKEASYIIFEFDYTSEIKIRMYIQSLIKFSLMQKSDSEYVKVADAKFINSPFLELKAFIKEKDGYLKELSEKKKKSLVMNRQQQITSQMIKAMMKKKSEGKNIVWSLEPVENGFILKIINDDEIKNYRIDSKNFVEVIKEI